ncbi:MAG: TonB family protein [Saprospirales bacterium]|nr:TonB family protein [Saprospirales bacterium]
MLADFLSKNLVYPKEANLNRFEGKTFISFCVNENGSLSDFKIQKSSYKILDEEAMRVAQLMNNWVPAHQDGKAKKK